MAALAAAVALLAACAADASTRAATAHPAAADLELFLRELERIHPDPYHATSQETYRRIVDDVTQRLDELDDDQLLVELMRLVALLGERDGHANLSPLSTAHRREMHLYPFWSFRFGDGLYIVAAAGRPDLVGWKVTRIQGRPIDEILALVEPLTPRDNEWSLRSRSVLPLVTAEVLHGLGVTPTAEGAIFTLERQDGTTREVELKPLQASEYTRGLRHAYPAFINGLPKRSKPMFVSRRGTQQWLRTLQGGRTVYLAYNLTLNDTSSTARRLLRLAQNRRVVRVIVDLRNNPGGEISTYPPLLRALRSRAVVRRRLIILTGRATFSAAVHFASDLKRSTRAVFLGEPTGGAPNHYSDTASVELPATGWVIGIPKVRYEKLPGESGLTIEPNERIELSAADFFAGRDPVLAAALRLR